jgi:RNA polymerase sigma-70 factor (ECF subfamily)
VNHANADKPEAGPVPASEFERLAVQHKDSVYRQMIRVCGNREDAEDVLIEALLKAYRSLNGLQAEEAFRAWLARIASRVCWQLKKREALAPVMQLSALEEGGMEAADPAPSAEDRAAGAQLKAILREALESLPENYRRVYELRAVEELSGEETAARLGLSLAAMKSRWYRARTLLRRRLDATLTSSQ